MPKKPVSYHGERDSQFFGLRSKAKLASLLFISLEKLKALASADDLYFEFNKPKASGGFREISAPRDDLKAVQSRIADLLQRIAAPGYLFAPVAGRSYVDNAAQHLGATSVRLLDIEDFFPSCTANKVIWFFSKRMECSPDVAAILRGVVTRNGSLPQGSPCSPILAYFCYIEMWEEVAKIVHTNRCRLSVYADDLTISGSVVPGQAIWQIKQALRKHGHQYNVSKERSKRLKPVEITGVILNRDSLLAPNRQHKKLHAVRQELRKARSSKQRATLEAQFKGRIAQMGQIVDAKSHQ